MSQESTTAVLVTLGANVIHTAGTTLNGAGVLVGVTLVSNWTLNTINKLIKHFVKKTKHDDIAHNDGEKKSDKALITITKEYVREEATKVGIVGTALLVGLFMKWSGSQLLKSGFVKTLEAMTDTR